MLRLGASWVHPPSPACHPRPFPVHAPGAPWRRTPHRASANMSRTCSGSGWDKKGFSFSYPFYDADRFELVQQVELHDINPENRVRSPLVVHVKLKATGQAFLFMVNHLFRTDTDARHAQARLLNAWAREQTLPVVAVGDDNFDWDVAQGETRHDRGFDEMVKDGVFVWVRPPLLVATQCSRQFTSVLDFVFAAHGAKAWQGASEILERQPAYCPDTNATSDHRPVLATFTLSGVVPAPGSRAEILAQIARIERGLRELKALIEQLPE